MIEIFINNQKLVVEKNLTVLQACEQANINIPRFCYHEQLSVAGNCRMCLVEIEKSPKPVASCAMPLTPGMVIFTDTPLVKKAREAVIEFLLLNHPLDCPICDQGGECDLQDLTLNFGADRSRFFEFKHGVEDKECGPIVKTIMTRCIHCTRCVRFLTEVAGLEWFGALGRGELMEIGPFFSKYLKTELAGNLVDLCPVGALTSKPYSFLARNWELKKTETLDFLDASGSNIVIHTRNDTTSQKNLHDNLLIKDQILRVLPKLQHNLNEHWLSDKSRYALDGLEFNRLTQILAPAEDYIAGIRVKKYLPLEWSNGFLTYFLYFFTEELKKSLVRNKSFGGGLGKLLTIEEIYFFFKFLKTFGHRNILIETSIYNFNIDLPIFYQFNSLFVQIEHCDFLTLFYTNPRFDSALLNIKVRKQFFNKEILIAYCGAFQEFTYPVYHLGQSFKNIIKLTEGKHKLTQKFRQSQFPLIIIGNEVGSRVDSNAVQALFLFFAKKCFLFLNKFNGYNILHGHPSFSNFSDLGIALNTYSPLYKLQSQKTVINEFNWILNNNEKFLFKPYSVFCNLQSFNKNLFVTNNNRTIIIPTNTVYERGGLLSNTEGFIQKAYKSISPLPNSRNSEDFFKSLILLHKQTLKNSWTTKALIFENPFLYNILQKRKHFMYNFKLQKNFSRKIFFILQNQQVTLKQFFMLDPISKNSKVMAECNLFLNQNTNFN
jgi:NADH-quinone oxidoreductase chain G